MAGAILGFILAIKCINAAFPPEQIHIGVGLTPDQMSFNWVTFDNPIITKSIVNIGKIDTNLDMTFEGKSIQFIDGGSSHTVRTIHVVNVSGLDASTKYYYQVGDPSWNGGWSTIYYFKTPPNKETLSSELPLKFAIYGDMGNYNAVILPNLTETVLKNEIDLILHVGDFAYNYQDDDGIIGDDFMNDIQNVATRVPYMVSVGNHESAYNFSDYSFRFMGMPNPSGIDVWTSAGPTPNNWYYSFNYGLVHIIAISTEIYYDFPYMIEQQYNWLEHDLIAANKNRTNAPWVIVHGHRPLYCSTDESTCQESATTLRLGVLNKTTKEYEYGLESLFYKYGVDFMFVGHVHNYERMYDIYNYTTEQTTTNMKATTYILTGNGGNCEYTAKFQETKPVWSAFRGAIYGYTHFNVYNSTHIYLQQIGVDRDYGNSSIVDQVWYIQHNHGPFITRKDRNIITDYKSPKIGADISQINRDDSISSQECPIQSNEYNTKSLPYLGNNKELYRHIDDVYF